jgi:hypothetical protein
LLTLTAIEPGRSESLREYLESLPLGVDSPFASLEQAHFARFVVIPQLIHISPPPEKPDTLKNEYLLFSADFDGSLDRFLDAICDSMAAEADAAWGHCVGYPGTGDRSSFKGYIRHNQIDTTMPFAAYPDATVNEVREALGLRARLTAFAIRAQGMEGTGLHDAFLDEFAT